MTHGIDQVGYLTGSNYRWFTPTYTITIGPV